MPVSFQSLPREIVDLCIDEFNTRNDKSSRKALLACHQVSRPFCSRSRQHIFRQISFNGDDLEKVWERLETLNEIMHPGGIAHCIRVFEIIIDSSQDKSETDFEDLLRDEEEVLGNVVSKLSTLRKFSLAMTATPYKSHIHNVDWEDLGPLLQDSICKLVHQPSLSVLHLGNIHGISSDFLDDTTLQHLHLAHTQFTGETDPPARINRALGCVTMNPSDCLNGIAGGYQVHLGRLVTFSSTIFKNEHLDITREVIKASADSMKSLQLDFYETFPTPLQPLNLGQLSQIKNLAVTHTVTMPDEGIDLTTSARFDQDVEHIHTLLETPTIAYSLRTVQLMVTSWQIYPGDNFFGNPPGEHSKWHFVDTLLTGPKYPALSVVGLYLTLPVLVDRVESFDQKGFKKKVEEFFKKVLPGLAATKRIRFMFEAQVVLFGWGDEQTANVIEDDEAQLDDLDLDDLADLDEQTTNVVEDDEAQLDDLNLDDAIDLDERTANVVEDDEAQLDDLNLEDLIDLDGLIDLDET